MHTSYVLKISLEFVLLPYACTRGWLDIVFTGGISPRYGIKLIKRVACCGLVGCLSLWDNDGVMRRGRYLISASLILGLMILMLFLLCQGMASQNVVMPKPIPEDVVGAIWDFRLMTGAEGRIEKYRKGDATVIVTDGEGVPVPAKVTAEMLQHDFLFGCGLLNLNSYQSKMLNEKYEQYFLELFNYATLPFFWDGYEPEPGNTAEDYIRGAVSWAKSKGIVVQGHPLIWALSEPGWAVEYCPDEMEVLQQSRISGIVKRFCPLVDYWNVLNEPCLHLEDSGAVGKWLQAYGIDAVTIKALELARANCGEAKLLVNDFNVSDEYLSFLQNLVEQKAPLDAIGLQAHMHGGVWRLNYIWDICERFSRFGIPLQFTEVTVLSGGLQQHDGDDYGGTTEEAESYQAKYVSALYTLLFSHPAVEGITWWDLSDLNAWKGAPAGLLRRDMSPKPAYESLRRLIKVAWWTNESILCNGEGVAKWRGFYGLYRLSIEHEGKKMVTDVHLAKNADNVFRLRLP